MSEVSIDALAGVNLVENGDLLGGDASTAASARLKIACA